MKKQLSDKEANHLGIVLLWIATGQCKNLKEAKSLAIDACKILGIEPPTVREG